MPHYITPERIPRDKGIYDFTRTFSVEKETTVTVRIFAMTRYILTLNGKYIGEGPCRTIPDHGFYDTYTVTLPVGENAFCARILHMGLTAFGRLLEFSTVQRSFLPKLLFEAAGEDFRLEGDKDWKILFYGGHDLVYTHPSIGFIAPWERVDTTAPVTELAVRVQEPERTFGTERGTGYGFWEDPYLFARPIPPIVPEEKKPFTVVRRGEGFAELDAGRYETAKVSVRLSGKGKFKLIYAECYEFPDGKHRRDDISGTLSGGYDTVLVDGETEFHSFWFRSFRYIRIEWDGPDMDFSDFFFETCHYPLSLDGTFSCSDEHYNQMYAVSAHTLLCCLHEIFVDCPYYEQQQYVMDTAIEASVLMCLSHDLRPVRKCIDELAASQIPEGLLCANYPATYHQIIPGFSFFWVFLLREYFDRSGDRETVLSHLSTADKIFSYFDGEIRRDGLIGRSAYWDFADWVDGWKLGVPPVERDDAITLYNLYYICALRAAAYLCEKVGRGGLGAEYAARAKELSETVLSRCYDEKEGLLRDGAFSGGFSAHTVVWGILSEVLTGKRAERACEKLFTPALSDCSFSMNYYLFRALEKCGRYDLAFSQVLPKWLPMLENHCTTWCEDTSKAPRSECHAWSCAPLYEFAARVLGVSADEGGITVAPQCGKLAFAKGTVPTRFGIVSVDWTVEDESFTLRIGLPDGAEATVLLPDGEKKKACGSAAFTCQLRA